MWEISGSTVGMGECWMWSVYSKLLNGFINWLILASFIKAVAEKVLKLMNKMKRYMIKNMSRTVTL